MEPQSFTQIRTWRGSQDQAFEELCYQLRDPTPPGAELIKTGSPDGGLEWYVKHRNGIEWGWQAKFSTDIDSLLKLMEVSLRTVIKKRPRCRRLTFCIPIDLSDQPAAGKRKGARQKFEDRKKQWRKRISGADRVTIELWGEGALLQRLNGHPNQRGISWFFWDQEIFTREWCEKRLAVTVQAAGERYTPELHVDLPVAFSLEGLAQRKTFWQSYRRHRERVAKLAKRVHPRRRAGLGVTPQLRNLSRAVDSLESVATSPGFPRTAILTEARTASEACADAPPRRPDARPRRNKTSSKASKDQEKRALRYDLDRLADALFALEEFLESPAAAAADDHALLVIGEAGQGKTHLFCDAGKGAIESSQPAVVLLAGQFPGKDPWSAIARQLGLGDIGSEALLGAMEAAGEASDRQFLLFIDALNEADDPGAWQKELPALLAELAANPRISVALSIRSSFLPVVLPPEGLTGIAEVEHPGFQGRELEATERFFDHFRLQQPRIPLLTPEFTNPLFLKLYCEGLQGLGLSSPPAGEAHISDVFGRYLDWKEKRIVQVLKVDPASTPVAKALSAFSDKMVAEGAGHLSYDEGSEVINSFAPSATEWPKTLLGQLLAEGILTAEIAWNSRQQDYERVLRFTYQRFGDFRAVGALLGSLASEHALRSALAPGQPLRSAVMAAPAGWIEALSVVLPERFNLELLDAANWRLKVLRRHMWDRALIRSITSRRPDAVTHRSQELLGAAQRRSPELSEAVLGALLAAAPNPDHPLNADYLHGRLMEFSLPDRDQAWSMPTYFVLNGGGPLDRIIRWAARGRGEDTPDDVALLAAMAMAWVFTSPNRRLRDYATKALSQFLAPRVDVLIKLLERFQGVNDPYVMERLIIVAHGAVLLKGRDDPQAARRVADVARTVALADDQVPNMNTRDAVRGIWEWCSRHGLASPSEYDRVKPPYGSAPPDKPRTKKQLERAYDRLTRTRKGHHVRSDYASLFMSLFDLGDFGRYVAGSKLSHFTRYPLEKPKPKARQPRRRVDKKKWAALIETLSPEQAERLAAEDSIFGLDADLSDDQRRLLFQAVNPPAPRNNKAEYPAELANRWIFERVLSLGWTPEAFDEWEQLYAGERAGRSGHKRERFGKKYQWIALHELIARVADNFHMKADWGPSDVTYEGPWQFFGRDIDPTLPPPGRTRTSDGDFSFEPTFPPDDRNSWWVPLGPSFGVDDPQPPDDWASQTADIPRLEDLVKRTAPDEKSWVVLQAYYNWDEERDGEGDIQRSQRRNMWSHIKSWLVESSDRGKVVKLLRPRSLMNNWMPEGHERTDASYLAEMPWAESTREYPIEWEEIEPREPTPQPSGLSVYPTWMQYLWEGNVQDCSINDGVHVMLPAPLLFDRLDLQRDSDGRKWTDEKGNLVAQYRESDVDRHSALLIQGLWLTKVLQEEGWSLVVGWLGEKQLFGGGRFSPSLIGSWTEMNGVASFDGVKWQFPKPRFNKREVARQD